MTRSEDPQPRSTCTCVHTWEDLLRVLTPQRAWGGQCTRQGGTGTDKHHPHQKTPAEAQQVSLPCTRDGAWMAVPLGRLRGGWPTPPTAPSEAEAGPAACALGHTQEKQRPSTSPGRAVCARGEGRNPAARREEGQEDCGSHTDRPTQGRASSGETQPRWPGPAGGRLTFLASLGAFLAAGAGLFPVGAGVRDGGGRAPRLAPPHAGGASESGGIPGEPCPRQRGNQLTWGTAQEPHDIPERPASESEEEREGGGREGSLAP